MGLRFIIKLYFVFARILKLGNAWTNREVLPDYILYGTKWYGTSTQRSFSLVSLKEIKFYLYCTLHLIVSTFMCVSIIITFWLVHDILYLVLNSEKFDKPQLKWMNIVKIKLQIVVMCQQNFKSWFNGNKNLLLLWLKFYQNLKKTYNE